MNEIKAMEKILGVLEIPAETYLTEEIIGQDISIFEKVSRAVEAYVLANKERFNLETPTIEGESKKIHKSGKLALVSLKPTMYSFTHNRYGTVEGTDLIRLDFWRLFATKLNSFICETSLKRYTGEFSQKISELLERGVIEKNYPIISNYLGEATIGSTRYAIIRFAEEIPPLEVVWKNYMVGTLKHNLKKVDAKRTKQGTLIQYEARLPNDMIRFDWRNPLPDKDECIPDEFAAFYIDTQAAREVARLTSRLLNHILKNKGYELIDLCYFMNYEGNMIYSEITPDGMRIRKKEQSYDKDLWRAGKDKETITSVWKGLYEDLRCAP